MNPARFKLMTAKPTSITKVPQSRDVAIEKRILQRSGVPELLNVPVPCVLARLDSIARAVGNLLCDIRLLRQPAQDVGNITSSNI